MIYVCAENANTAITKPVPNVAVTGNLLQPTTETIRVYVSYVWKAATLAVMPVENRCPVGALRAVKSVIG